MSANVILYTWFLCSISFNKFLHFIVRSILFGNYNGFFTIAYTIYDDELPSNGNFPVTNKYNITPQAHTSTAGLFIFVLPDNTSGDIYLNVPQSTSGLNLFATPLIPKSAILMVFAYFYLYFGVYMTSSIWAKCCSWGAGLFLIKIFYNFRSLWIIPLRWQ